MLDNNINTRLVNTMLLVQGLARTMSRLINPLNGILLAPLPLVRKAISGVSKGGNVGTHGDKCSAYLQVFFHQLLCILQWL